MLRKGNNMSVKKEETKDDTTAVDSEYGTIFDALAVMDGDTSTLSVKSFHEILHEIGLNPTDEEVKTLLDSVGLDMDSHINKEQFETLMAENEHHNSSLQEAAFKDSTESTPLSRKASVKNTLDNKSILPNGHSDMYWIEFTKQEWPDFPNGFTMNAQNRMKTFAKPAAITRTDFILPEAEDILLMIDQKNVDKRLYPADIYKVIAARLATNEKVHLKLRRHVDHKDYTGEYIVAFHEVPTVGEVKDNVILGPLNSETQT